MNTHATIAPEALNAAMQHMAAAAKEARQAGQPAIARAVLTAVAHLIAGAGPAGGIKQAQMIDTAEEYGMIPHYTANGVHVCLEEVKG